MSTISFPHALVLVVPWWLLLLIVALLLLTLGVLFKGRLWLYLKHWEPVSADLHFADIGTVKIQPNHRDLQLAHKAWVELATRKAGLPFDPDHDVIVEIYDSWYELFARLRELSKECPATKIRSDESTRELIVTLTQVLNHGMRPHLTKWQAKFRRWYAAALEEAAADCSPQDVQREYAEYDSLVAELREVQDGLRRYTELLRQLATGECVVAGASDPPP